MFELPEIRVDAQDSLNFLGRVFPAAQSFANLLQGKDPLAPFTQLGSDVLDPFGLGSKKKKSDAEGAATAAAISKTDALIKSITGDSGLDEISRRELLTKLNAGIDVEQEYKQALGETGVYGKRRKNEQIARLMTDTPGQKQLFLSNQQRVAAGQATLGFGTAQSGPLLTGGQR